jgi:hypothetical protein
LTALMQQVELVGISMGSIAIYLGDWDCSSTRTLRTETAFLPVCWVWCHSEGELLRFLWCFLFVKKFKKLQLLVGISHYLPVVAHLIYSNLIWLECAPRYISFPEQKCIFSESGPLDEAAQQVHVRALGLSLWAASTIVLALMGLNMVAILVGKKSIPQPSSIGGVWISTSNHKIRYWTPPNY